MNKIAQKLLALSFIALLLSACGTAGISVSQQRAESLLGEWSFSHPDASPSSQSYSFNILEQNSELPDSYAVYGASGSGADAFAMYNPESTIAEKYIVGEPGTWVNHIYVFKFDLSNRVSGFYGQLDAVSGEVISSVSFTGVRSGTNVQMTSVQPASPYDVEKVLEAYKSIRSK